MLTLGMFEGTILLAALVLLFIAGAEEEFPWHRLLGVAMLGLLGAIAYRVVDVDLGLSAAEIGGLAFGAVLLMAPVAVIRYAWHETQREHEEAAAQLEARIHALPERRAAAGEERRAA